MSRNVQWLRTLVLSDPSKTVRQDGIGRRLMTEPFLDQMTRVETGKTPQDLAGMIDKLSWLVQRQVRPVTLGS